MCCFFVFLSRVEMIDDITDVTIGLIKVIGHQCWSHDHGQVTHRHVTTDKC